MKIRNKILIYFSVTVIVLTAICLSIVYVLFSEYREEEFQQRQNEKVKYTINLTQRYQDMSEELARIMDRLSINDFYDEKMMVFDSQKSLIFSSIDDLTIHDYQRILNELSPNKRWIETKEGDYDLVGVYVEEDQKSYYAVSKAFDNFGYSKLNFLKNVLLGIFATITAMVILVSMFLSAKISLPITTLAGKLAVFDFANPPAGGIKVQTSTYELQLLTARFNELLHRVDEAFSFQKHSIHHISHELKTPVAVLVSELERLKSYKDPEQLKADLEIQISKAKSLGDIINSLLEISKIDAGQQIHKENIRVDELLFDLIEEINLLHPDFHFELQYLPENIDESRLIIHASKMLMKQAFQNLLTNCTSYSDNHKASIKIDGTNPRELIISFMNPGAVVDINEQKFLFHHFFRGENSRGKTGFGLGLVLTQKIITLNGGQVTYTSPKANQNLFKATFPLS